MELMNRPRIKTAIQRRKEKEKDVTWKEAAISARELLSWLLAHERGTFASLQQMGIK